MSDHLSQAPAPWNTGAAFSAAREGGFVLLTPLTPHAATWLRENLSAETTWAGDALVVERDYFPTLADAIIAAGFLFEGEAYLD